MAEQAYQCGAGQHSRSRWAERQEEATAIPVMAEQYPPAEPHQSGMLDVGDGNLVYWEMCGNPAGKPALVVHGGPGSGCTAGQRRWFDPGRYRVVLFDQRMCGRSKPLADDPAVDLGCNTTGELVADMERLRRLYRSKMSRPV